MPTKFDNPYRKYCVLTWTQFVLFCYRPYAMISIGHEHELFTPTFRARWNDQIAVVEKLRVHHAVNDNRKH